MFAWQHKSFLTWNYYYLTISGKYSKKKSFLEQALISPWDWDSHISRKPTHWGGKFVSPTYWLPLPPSPTKILLALIYVNDWVNPKVIVRPEGLWNENSSDLIGNRTRDLPACNAVPQPPASPRDTGEIFFNWDTEVRIRYKMSIKTVFLVY